MCNPTSKFITPSSCYTIGGVELWWDINIKVMPSVKSNKPDIVLWRKKEKECCIIDVCIPLDINVTSNEKVKRDKYVQLAGGLKRLYNEYNFKVIPVVIGATGYVPKTLTGYLREIGFSSTVIPRLIQLLQKKAILGSVKVIKTAMKLK